MAYPGEALSAAVACRLLNAQSYRSVEVWDAHSDVSLALLDRVRHRPASDFAAPIVTARDVIVAPDLGAVKRASAYARAAGVPLVQAEKTRSTDAGAVTGSAVHSDPIGDRDFLIADDICDGGRTFIELAKVLRPLTRSQALGGLVWGIGSALRDGTAVDRRAGGWLNRDLGEYLLPVNVDIGALDTIVLDEADPKLGQIGAKGLGGLDDRHCGSHCQGRAPCDRGQGSPACRSAWRTCCM